MKNRIPASSRRLAVCATLLLLVATASGCGVAMPTQPAIDSGATVHRAAAGAGVQEAGDPFELGEIGTSGGAGDAPPPSPPSGGDEDVVAEPGPGNSDWGHQRKGPKS